MKKYLFLFLSFIMATFCFSSCSDDDEEEVSYTSADLVGYWHFDSNKSIYYRFDNNGEGATWDTSDDVHEDDIVYGEDGSFDWSLDSTKLTFKHRQTTDRPKPTSYTTRLIPKSYTITVLNNTTLKFEDEFEKFSYTKTTKPE